MPLHPSLANLERSAQGSAAHLMARGSVLCVGELLDAAVLGCGVCLRPFIAFPIRGASEADGSSPCGHDTLYGLYCPADSSSGHVICATYGTFALPKCGGKVLHSLTGLLWYLCFAGIPIIRV